MKLKILPQIIKYVKDNNPEELYGFAISFSKREMAFNRCTEFMILKPKIDNNKFSLHKIKENGSILKSKISFEENNISLEIYTDLEEAIFNYKKRYEEEYKIYSDKKNYIEEKFKSFKEIIC